VSEAIKHGSRLRRVEEERADTLTCIDPCSTRVLDGVMCWVGLYLVVLPAPDSCWIPRAGWRVKGRVAPAGGAVGALDAATREWIMGASGREGR
jgi:hypothetical protein